MFSVRLVLWFYSKGKEGEQKKLGRFRGFIFQDSLVPGSPIRGSRWNLGGQLCSSLPFLVLADFARRGRVFRVLGPRKRARINSKKVRDLRGGSRRPAMGKPTTAKKPPPEGGGDEEVFLELSRELKEEGTRLFNRKDYEGAAFKYDKAAQLVPGGHVEAAHLRTSVAQCYMRMVPAEYHRAIHECNLALEVAPRYSRALLRRAGCFQALDRPDLAWGDVEKVLGWEPGNRAAREISESVKAALKEKGVVVLDREVEPVKEEANGECKRKISHNYSDSVVNGHKVNRAADNMEINNGQEMEEECAEGTLVDHVKYEQATQTMEKKLRNEHNKQENHLEDNQVKQCKQGKHAEHKVANGNGNHQKHMGDKETNGFEKEQKVAGGKRGKRIAGKKIRHGEGKEQKHSDVKPVDHCQENHHKHSTESNISVKAEVMRDLKLVFGEDIRCAQMPVNGSLSQLREIVQNKFPSLKALLVKYRDKEDDLVTITSSEELRLANKLADPEVPIRLYVAEVDPIQELGVDVVSRQHSFATLQKNHNSLSENGSARRDNEQNCHVDDWILQFARLFKTHVGFDSDAYLDLHDLGMRLYCEAMEDTIASEEAQEIFQVAEQKFQEMAALALFNWGNINMSRARKRPLLSEDGSFELILEQIKAAYEWACSEYAKAGSKYEEAVKTKPDFFEGLIALGQQQFEQAKLSWYYAIACKIDMGTEVLGLFNHAEDNMEKGMELWEGMENMRLRGLSKPNKENSMLEKMGLEGYTKDLSADEAFEQASSIRSHINILWGTILYERSVVEFSLGLPSWEESLTVAMEKFKTGGASLADINVMVKNHCANETTQEGLSFKVEEIVQAWNEMYDAKKWRTGAPSFRLEPIFRRRAPKLHHILEHIHYT